MSCVEQTDDLLFSFLLSILSILRGLIIQQNDTKWLVSLVCRWCGDSYNRKKNTKWVVCLLKKIRYNNPRNSMTSMYKSRIDPKTDQFQRKILRIGLMPMVRFFIFFCLFFHCFLWYVGNDNIRPKPPHGTDKVYVAIYDYDARTDEDLTFRVGDLLLILDDR